MFDIKEERIRRDKEPLFIDYSKIYGDSKKKLLLLRALIQIINTRADYIEFSDLKLSSDDEKLFIDFLKKYYPGNFDPKKKKINLFENYEGKIICGIDQMIEDLFSVLSKENVTLDSPLIETSEKNTQGQNGDDDKEEEILTYSIFEIFYDWIFLEKYDKDNFDDESKLYLDEFVKYNESDLKNFFNIQTVRDEVIKNFKKSNFKNTEIVKIRAKLTTFLEKIETHFHDKDYWSNLIIETKKCFKDLIDATTILKNEKMKLFLTSPGNPQIQNVNKVISYYKNKPVLFDKDASIFPNLKVNQIVLSEIKYDGEKNYIVNPIRIIDPNEAKMLLLFGVEAAPSTDFVSHFLDDNS